MLMDVNMSPSAADAGVAVVPIAGSMGMALSDSSSPGTPGSCFSYSTSSENSNSTPSDASYSPRCLWPTDASETFRESQERATKKARSVSPYHLNSASSSRRSSLRRSIDGLGSLQGPMEIRSAKRRSLTHKTEEPAFPINFEAGTLQFGSTRDPGFSADTVLLALQQPFSLPSTEKANVVPVGSALTAAFQHLSFNTRASPLMPDVPATSSVQDSNSLELVQMNVWASDNQSNAIHHFSNLEMSRDHLCSLKVDSLERSILAGMKPAMASSFHLVELVDRLQCPFVCVDAGLALPSPNAGDFKDLQTSISLRSQSASAIRVATTCFYDSAPSHSLISPWVQPQVTALLAQDNSFFSYQVPSGFDVVDSILRRGVDGIACGFDKTDDGLAYLQEAFNSFVMLQEFVVPQTNITEADRSRSAGSGHGHVVLCVVYRFHVARSDSSSSSRAFTLDRQVQTVSPPPSLSPSPVPSLTSSCSSIGEECVSTVSSGAALASVPELSQGNASNMVVPEIRYDATSPVPVGPPRTAVTQTRKGRKGSINKHNLRLDTSLCLPSVSPPASAGSGFVTPITPGIQMVSTPNNPPPMLGADDERVRNNGQRLNEAWKAVAAPWNAASPALTSVYNAPTPKFNEAISPGAVTSFPTHIGAPPQAAAINSMTASAIAAGTPTLPTFGPDAENIRGLNQPFLSVAATPRMCSSPVESQPAQAATPTDYFPSFRPGMFNWQPN